MLSDAYEQLGEFHDLFMDSAWANLSPVLADVFAGLAGDCVVADLGAGTGIGTRALARVTAAEIVAVEPSLTMRAVLTARVSDDPDLRTRVSVLAGRLPGTLDGLPALDGFVCAHVLGHLAPSVRAESFIQLAGLLKPSALGVVVVSPEPTGTRPVAVHEERHIGRHRYVARHLPASDGAYTSEYQVLDGDTLVRSERFAGTWATITVDELAAEIAPAGFSVTGRGPGIGVVSIAS